METVVTSAGDLVQEPVVRAATRPGRHRG